MRSLGLTVPVQDAARRRVRMAAAVLGVATIVAVSPPESGAQEMSPELLERASRQSGNDHTRRAFDWIAVIVFGQLVLGVGTVLYAAPLHLAIVHQFGAIVLWVLVLRGRFLAQYPLPQTINGPAS